jgi:hypothetical protein
LNFFAFFFFVFNLRFSKTNMLRRKLARGELENGDDAVALKAPAAKRQKSKPLTKEKTKEADFKAFLFGGPGVATDRAQDSDSEADGDESDEEGSGKRQQSGTLKCTHGGRHCTSGLPAQGSRELMSHTFG